MYLDELTDSTTNWLLNIILLFIILYWEDVHTL
jgi:hypothetical protein